MSHIRPLDILCEFWCRHFYIIRLFIGRCIYICRSLTLYILCCFVNTHSKHSPLWLPTTAWLPARSSSPFPIFCRYLDLYSTSCPTWTTSTFWPPFQVRLLSRPSFGYWRFYSSLSLSPKSCSTTMYLHQTSPRQLLSLALISQLQISYTSFGATFSQENVLSFQRYS